MAATNANEPKLTLDFAGTAVVNDLTRIPLRDGNIMFPPVPLHLDTLYTSHPLDRANEELGVATFPFIWSQLPESTVKCCAKPLSGHPQFFLKVVLHLEAGRNSLQFAAWNDLLNEACFYSERLLEFQADIVPRHYGVFAGKTSWGGTIACAVLDYFPGLPWTWIQNGPGDTLESEYVHFSLRMSVPTSRFNLVSNL
jgi:hypothetical protein